MSKVLGSVSFQCGWEAEPVSSVALPGALIFKVGKASTSAVLCRIMVGSTQLVPSSLNNLSANRLDNLVTSLKWNFANGNYQFIYDGKADINTVITLRPVYNGVEYPCTLQVLTVKEGENGEDAYSADISPSEVTFVRGKAETVTLDSAIYKGETALTHTVSCNTTLPAFLSFEAPDELSYNGSTAGAVTDKTLTFSLTPSNGGPTMTKTVRIRFEDPPVRGHTGPFVPPIRMWEDYETGYQFQPGADGDERKDVVLYKTEDGTIFAATCLVKHSKPAVGTTNYDKYTPWYSYPAGTPTNQRYWSSAQKIKLVATDVLLADQAFIGLMSGNAIRIYDSARNVVGEIVGTTEDGNSFVIWIGNKDTDGTIDPLWAVNALGTHFIGGISGQRIEINPSNKDLSVYDSDGALVATHSGRYIDPATVIPSAASGQNYGITLSAQSLSASGKKNWTSTNTTKKLTGNGVMKIPIPSFTLKAKRKEYNSSALSELAPKTTATLDLVVYINGVIERKITLGRVESSAMSSQANTTATSSTSNTNREITLAIPARTEVVPMKAGDTFLAMLTLTVTMLGGHGTDGFGSITWGATAMTCSYTADCYRAEYGSNGWVISCNTDNYAYFLVGKDKKMYAKCVSAGEVIFPK
ncbi:MAG: hypothetical protein HDS13_00200 [Bacteroides sp.]|nr:hypothetical protein [Bacteroides sp.]